MFPGRERSVPTDDFSTSGGIMRLADAASTDAAGRSEAKTPGMYKFRKRRERLVVGLETLGSNTQRDGMPTGTRQPPLLFDIPWTDERF